MSSKRCFKCQCVKPIDAFYKHVAMKDGRLNKCIECTKKDVIEHRIKRIEYYRQYDKERASKPNRVLARKQYRSTEAGKKAVARAHASYKARFPNRDLARQMVSNALRDKKIQKQGCFVCGDKAEAHHPDYDRPLDVVWLCDLHHKQTHALARSLEKYQEAA